MMLKRPFWNYIRLVFLDDAEKALYHAAEDCVNWEMYDKEMYLHLRNGNRMRISMYQDTAYASFGLSDAIEISNNLYRMMYMLVYPELQKLHKQKAKERLIEKQQEVKAFLTRLQ